MGIFTAWISGKHFDKNTTNLLFFIRIQKNQIMVGIEFIGKLQTIIQQHWTHRNETLHETEARYNLSGIDTLKQAISDEYSIELGSLPSVYSSYFLMPLPSILLKPTSHLKQWFLVIHSGIEASCPNIRIDKFYTETCLRSWIGLKKNQHFSIGIFSKQSRLRALCLLK